MQNSGWLLLVEDEPLVQANNKKILERRGYAIRQAYSLAEAWAIIAEDLPRAIVLDIQLPDGSGLDFLRELRGKSGEWKVKEKSNNTQRAILNSQLSKVPVLMLTAMGTPQDIVRGLEAGGDDYLPKPYDLSVFLTRVEALLRRASLMPDTLEIGALKLDTASGTAFLNGEDMLLARKEYSLLQLFVQNPFKTFSAECLYEKVWKQEIAGDDGALKKAVSRLRAKLAGSEYTIIASRREGYHFEQNTDANQKTGRR